MQRSLMTFKSFEFYFVHVLPSNETHAPLACKPVHFSASVVIGTKIFVLNNIAKKNPHIVFLLYFLTFLYFICI